MDLRRKIEESGGRERRENEISPDGPWIFNKNWNLPEFYRGKMVLLGRGGENA